MMVEPSVSFAATAAGSVWLSGTCMVLFWVGGRLVDDVVLCGWKMSLDDEVELCCWVLWWNMLSGDVVDSIDLAGQE